MKSIPSVITIPASEEKQLDKLIKEYRRKYIRSSQEIVDAVFLKEKNFITDINNRQISKSISKLREVVWEDYLKDEEKFNVRL